MALDILCKMLSLTDSSPVVLYVTNNIGGRVRPIYCSEIQRETPRWQLIKDFPQFCLYGASKDVFH